MTSTTAHRIAGRRLPGRGNHAATNVFWLSTVAIFCQPSILRNLIWPVATRLKSSTTGRVFARQRALRFYASAELRVEPLNRVCRSQRLPLRFRKGKDCEQLVAAFAKARHHAWAALGPRALEARVSRVGGVSAGSVRDAVEVIAEVGQHMLGHLTLKIAELMDTTTLHDCSRPDLTDGPAQPGITIDDGQHGRSQPARDRVVSGG